MAELTRRPECGSAKVVSRVCIGNAPAKGALRLTHCTSLTAVARPAACRTTVCRAQQSPARKAVAAAAAAPAFLAAHPALALVRLHLPRDCSRAYPACNRCKRLLLRFLHSAGMIWRRLWAVAVSCRHACERKVLRVSSRRRSQSIDPSAGLLPRLCYRVSRLTTGWRERALAPSWAVSSI